MALTGRSILKRYGLAFLLAAIGLKVADLHPLRHVEGFGPLLLAIAVLLSAWHGGRGPGLFVTALTAAFTAHLVHDPFQAARHAVFIAYGALASQLVGSLQQARRRAEAAVRGRDATEGRYRRIVETASEGIWLLGGDGQVTYINRRGAAMLGREPDDLIGLELASFAEDSEASASIEAALQGLRAGRPARFNARLRRTGGAPLWARISTSPLEESGVGAGLVMVSDVTEPVAAQAALRRSESRFRRLSESGMIGVAVLNHDGRATEANDEFLRATGFDRIDLAAGRVNWSATTPPEFREQDRRKLRELAVAGVCPPFLKECVGKDGVRLTVLLGAARLDDGAGESVCFLLDVSARRRAEGALRLLAEAGEVLGASLDSAATLGGLAGLVVPGLADACAIEIGGRDGARHRVASSHDEHDPVVPPGILNAAEAEPLVARAIREGLPLIQPEAPDPMEAGGKGPGAGAPSLLVVPLAARGRALGALVLGRGPRRRKFDGEDLALAEDLARRAAMAVDNARLYDDANRARHEAESASLAKDKFLAALSHELRTPLTPVLAGVSALMDDPNLPESVRLVLEVTRRNVELEARLIDDLLDVTRIARGKIRVIRAPVDAHSLVRQVVEICRGEAEATGHSLVVDLSAADSHVEADSSRLQQVLWNLVKNAVKFTPPGGSVAVRTRNVPAEGQGPPRLVFEVVDSGIGISPENLPKIFNAFEQIDASVTQRFGGLGLGLAICRSLAEAHAAKLTAASEGRDAGATFTLDMPTIPVPAPVAAALAPFGHDQSRPEPLRILLTEDNADTRRMMARLLRNRGHYVATAEGVAEALKVADSEGPFDLLVSDIGLPDGSGHDLMRSLRLRPDRPPTGIALSGYGTEDDLQRSHDAGFVAHLTKPVDFSTLEAAIRRASVDVPSHAG